MIRLEGIGMAYVSGASRITALHGISLDVESGERVCIVGRSGSGKSTLLDVIGTLLTPSEGRYFLDGRLTTTLTEPALARYRNSCFGFVFQAFHLLDRLTVLDNARLGGSYAADPASCDARASEWIERLGLATLKHRRPQELSGGERQRVAIARALAVDPRLVLADEPTGNLDRENGELVLRALFEATDEQRGLILVTHDMSIAARFPRVLRMADGTFADT